MTVSQTGDVQYGVWLKNRGAVDVQEVLECAVAAEDAGWDGVFLSDSLTVDYTDPWTRLSGIATRTDQLTLATRLTPIPRRQPWQLAYQLATLDELCEGACCSAAGSEPPLNAPSSAV
jgi:alkanesulfonate monooxygenase SsuD/methylene tetrahydromethanopterin reductase-like flavin-dependent oxidoreductase (luciferase family)